MVGRVTLISLSSGPRITESMKNPSRLAIASVAAIAGGALAIVGATATAAKPRVSDFDAELKPGNRISLKVDARNASTVKFTFAGRTVTGRITDTDDDGEREFSRTVSAGSVKTGRRAFKVRACGSDGCTTRTFNERVEYDD